MREDAALAFSPIAPDRRPIYVWARDNIIEMPSAYALRGRFNVENSPWLKSPFDSMSNPLVRRTTVSKAIQSGGTLLAEIGIAWAVINDPGPMAFTCQSDEMAALEAKSRLWPLLDSIPIIGRIMPRPGPMRTQQEIFWQSGGFLVMNSANLAHQQSQSIKRRVNDEIWMPRWSDVYEDACKRVTAFEQQGTSHILDISQGGHEGDWAQWSFNNGTMEEWSANCKACGKSMPLHIHQRMIDAPDVRAGLVWEKDARRDDNTFDDVRAAETARFVCCHCGHEHDDTDATRAHWRRTGHYVVTRENPPIHWKSYHWEALTAHPMHLLAAEFCQAENHFERFRDDTARAKFRQKREARSWVIERETINLFVSEDDGDPYTSETFAGANRIPNEVARFMTIDRQKAGYWVEIRAWTAEPASWQLYFGKIETRDMLRVIQAKYAVPDSCVAQDRGYEPAKVDADCVAFGWRGLMGAAQQRKSWTMRNDTTGELENYPYSEPRYSIIGGGHSAPYYEFSTGHAKDLVAAAAKGTGLKWRQPSDVNPLYAEHLKSEEKREIRPGIYAWKEIRQDYNHGFDTSAMQVIVAVIAGMVHCRVGDEK